MVTCALQAAAMRIPHASLHNTRDRKSYKPCLVTRTRLIGFFNEKVGSRRYRTFTRFPEQAFQIADRNSGALRLDKPTRFQGLPRFIRDLARNSRQQSDFFLGDVQMRVDVPPLEFSNRASQELSFYN